MASREVVVNECDLGGKTEDGSGEVVVTHTVSIDGYAVEAEADEKCWQRALRTMVALSKKGRPIVPKRSSAPKAVPWPGSAWKFPSHALQRIGERNLNPMRVIAAAEEPESSHPGRKPEITVCVRGNTKAVVNVERHVIISAARRSESVEEEAA